jgi:hypothetical protein
MTKEVYTTGTLKLHCCKEVCLSLIFAGKASSLPLQWNSISDSSRLVLYYRHLKTAILKRNVLVTAYHFNPSLIFAAKVSSQPLQWSSISGSSRLVLYYRHLKTAVLKRSVLVTACHFNPSLIFAG